MKLLITSTLLLTFCTANFAFSQQAENKRQQTTTNRFSFVEDSKNDKIDILLDGKPYTSYLYADSLKKPVLYPLRTKHGNFVTRGWPLVPRNNERTDHPHHIGLWFNYGDVNGLDFWNNSTAIPSENRLHYGSIKQSRVDAISARGNRAILSVEKHWLDPSNDSLIRENTKYIFQVLKDGSTCIDLDVNLHALKDISFKDNKEGLIGIRVSRELEHPSDGPATFTDANGIATKVDKADNTGVTGNYLSSQGIRGDKVWATRGEWVSLEGRIQNEDISLVIIDHPENIGFPTYWHARGYGLFAANPLGQKEFSKGHHSLNYSLEKGKSVRFQYRVLIHSGSHLSAEQIEMQRARFTKK